MNRQLRRVFHNKAGLQTRSIFISSLSSSSSSSSVKIYQVFSNSKSKVINLA